MIWWNFFSEVPRLCSLIYLSSSIEIQLVSFDSVSGSSLKSFYLSGFSLISLLSFLLLSYGQPTPLVYVLSYFQIKSNIKAKTNPTWLQILLLRRPRPLGPFTQPGRHDRSVRQCVLCESPKRHDGPSRLWNRRRRYPSILLPQLPLHCQKLLHMHHRGRENAQTFRLLCHAFSSWFVFSPSFFSLFLPLLTQTDSPFFPQNSQFRAVVNTTRLWRRWSWNFGYEVWVWDYGGKGVRLFSLLLDFGGVSDEERERERWRGGGQRWQGGCGWRSAAVVRPCTMAPWDREIENEKARESPTREKMIFFF